MIKIKKRRITNYPLTDSVFLNRIYNARGISSPKELDYSLKNLLSYELLSGISLGTELLFEAWQQQQNIIIVGDFDADGATGTALAYLILKAFGFQKVSYCIPDRFRHGYGLTVKLVEELLLQKPDLILTVDNGITSYEGITLARRQGVKILVTDHHLSGEILPEANVIINPNQGGDNFPSKNLVGAGVVFYLMIAFRACLRQHGGPEVRLADFLDLVALGTIADAVELDYNNRILVAQGLKLIRKGNTRLGVLALLSEAKRDYRKVRVEDLAFAVVPRLNAAGRLEQMQLSVESLITLSNVRAIRLAKNLDKLNETRKRLSSQIFQQVISRAENCISSICLFEPQWHQGIIGVVASKVKEYFNLPVILFAPGSDGELKGSVRSVMGLNIRELLAELQKNLPETIRHFGGHAMAAGVSINHAHWNIFKEAFEAAVAKRYREQQPILEYLIDGELSPYELNLENALMLNQAGPFGVGFEEPLFYGEFTLLRVEILKQMHLKVVLRDERNQKDWEAIYFNARESLTFLSRVAQKLSLIYRLGVNDFNNNLRVQLFIVEVL